ncbi:hypothetical protein [Corallococcus aberystwythensis]|uniref:DUF1795 domain-containing protein n=1 Tax=Corallococcus aberystwythensis TaxID=2316722 RepID=A0A3A8R507_9BACT|nr:hypothetical protein [Corallococcus aberystwythensis]RKH74280.1 hypothetical protein D7W81_02130 [Corallococcus aberystwythensis]
MGAMRMLGWGVLLLSTACSASRTAVTKAEPGTGGSGSGMASDESAIASTTRRYVDEDLGFEIIRPTAEWQLDETNERTPEGLAIPVILRHRVTGAQVVLQVAPGVATPVQFAERLTVGLRQQPGFTTTDPQPIALSDSAVGFDFQVGEGVRGKVAVREGNGGRVLMMLATWPTEASAGITESVDALMAGVRPLPEPSVAVRSTPRTP